MLEAAQILLKSAHREPRPNFEPRILLQKGRNMQHMFQNMGGEANQNKGSKQPDESACDNICSLPHIDSNNEKVYDVGQLSKLGMCMQRWPVALLFQ